jgi:predicted nucleic acid-binding protein
MAAFAISSQCRLVSFDGDFNRFAGLDFLHLKTGV